MDTPTFFAIAPRQIINYFDEELPYLCYISLNQGNTNTKTYMYYLDHFLWKAYVLLSTGQKVQVCVAPTKDMSLRGLSRYIML